MKKNIIGILFLVTATTSFCQQTNTSHPLTREEYLAKSKHQKTAAWVLLGGGAALVGTGLLIGNRNESSFDQAATGGIIGIIGALSMIGSVPLFLAAEKNKRKGLSVSFKKEIAPQLFTGNFINRSIPAVNIRMDL
ncbi:MAG: hypothetical protein Q8941_22330 [Bacteroidota bacterium]|nr:hypothetical protein [Bacteroidota bacterium]